MRFLLRFLAVIVLGPIALFALFLVAVAAVVGLPLIWERVVIRLTAPPSGDAPTR